MRNGVIISLCDYTGIMVEPWVAAGYTAILIDPQHEKTDMTGKIKKIALTVEDSLGYISEIMRQQSIKMVFGFPVCTDLAVSGAAHFGFKRNNDLHFQAKAMQLVHECRVVGELSGAPWFIENPVSVISSIWRKPDYSFNPFEYGGYLPENDSHPQYPKYIVPRDAYPKKTCIWAGNGFVMPKKNPVHVEQGYSAQHKRLGGKSNRTKNIRSATPRGFAIAVYEANKETTN